MSTLLNPVPLGEAAGSELVDLGGTAGTEKLQASVVADCGVNGVEFSAKQSAPVVQSAELQKTDFSNILNSAPKPNGLG